MCSLKLGVYSVNDFATTTKIGCEVLVWCFGRSSSSPWLQSVYIPYYYDNLLRCAVLVRCIGRSSSSPWLLSVYIPYYYDYFIGLFVHHCSHNYAAWSARHTARSRMRICSLPFNFLGIVA